MSLENHIDFPSCMPVLHHRKILMPFKSRSHSDVPVACSSVMIVSQLDLSLGEQTLLCCCILNAVVAANCEAYHLAASRIPLPCMMYQWLVKLRAQPNKVNVQALFMPSEHVCSA